MPTKNNYQVLLFYKYIDIKNPEQLKNDQLNICKHLDLKGRTIISAEGINATVEGETSSVEKYIQILKTDERFKDIHFKKSESNGQAFPKLSIKVRDELVTLNLGSEDFSPHEFTGKRLLPEVLHSWIHEKKKEFYFVDMRNDYECASGHFEGSHIFKNMHNFRDLPNVINEIEHLKEKTIVTVCTGGIRCEKASGFLVKHGFKDVYQLDGGIVSYMEKYPNEDFLGKLYVFDNRVLIGFNTSVSSHKIIGQCYFCKKKSENYIDFKIPETGRRMHGIICFDCLKEKGDSLELDK